MSSSGGTDSTDYIITIPNGEGASVVQALCANHGYQSQINGQPNPQDPNAFAEQCVVDWLMQEVETYQGQQAAETARQQAVANVQATLTITVRSQPTPSS